MCEGGRCEREVCVREGASVRERGRCEREECEGGREVCVCFIALTSSLQDGAA